MPPLDEGSILDMPVTVPRVSVTEAAADLKTRDAIIRQFPEIELIVGKAGRADTPTDPSPLEMVESVITLRPKEHWPKRKLDYKDARRQMAVVLDALQKQNLIEAVPTDSDRHALIDTGDDERRAAVRRGDAGDGAGAVQGVRRPARPQAAAGVHRGTAAAACRRRAASRNQSTDADMDRLAEELQKEFAPILAAGPNQEDINRLMQKIVEKLASAEGGQKVNLDPESAGPELQRDCTKAGSTWPKCSAPSGRRSSPICGNTS